MKVTFSPKKSKDPNREGDIKVEYAPARRAFPRWRWYFVVLLVSSPLLFFFFKVGLGFLWASSPGVVFMEKASVNCPRPGLVTALPVLRGQELSSGDLIAKVVEPLLEARKAPLVAERRAILAQVPQLAQEGSLKKSLALAGKVLDGERDVLRQVQWLFERGAATRAELNEARGRVVRAEGDVIRAQADLEVASAAVDSPQNAVRLAQIEAELGAMEESQGEQIILSPIPGVVLDLYAEEGQTVAQGAPVATLGDPESVSVVAFVDPRYLSMIDLESPARVRFPGGTVMEADPEGRPVIAGPLPSALAEPFSEGKQTVQVYLKTNSPIPLNLMVEGLPVKAHWGFRLPWR